MSLALNRRVVLAERPAGPVASTCMRVEEVQVMPPSDKEVLVAVQTVAIEAGTRTMMDESAFHGSVPIGGLMPALGVGVVQAVGPQVKHLQVGQRVIGGLGAQTHATVIAKALQTLDASDSNAEALGLLGFTTGLTAWVGVHCAAKPPAPGNVAIVSAAAGAVGVVAAQLCKAAGARVIGVAGGQRKATFLLDELQLDGALDYHGDLASQLDALAPDGVDYFFDNAGGEILDVVLERLRPGARVVICGAASQYSGNLAAGQVRGPKNYLKLAERGASMVGFNIFQHPHRFEEARKELRRLHAEGLLKVPVHWVSGLDSYPGAMQSMFTGGHIGKMLVNVGMPSRL